MIPNNKANTPKLYHALRVSEIWLVKKNGFAAGCPLAELLYDRAV